MRRAMLVVGLLGVAAMVSYGALSSPAAVSCARLAKAPTVDGILGPTEWSRAAAVGPFVIDGGGMPSLVTQAWIGFDGEALYLAAQLSDPMPLATQSVAAVRDGNVLADDSFAVKLDPGNDGSGVIELAVNPAGVEYDSVDGDATKDVTWRSAVHLGDDGWVVEIAYPFGDNGAPTQATVWGLNLTRRAPRVAERSSMTGGGMGTLRLGGPALRCEVAPIDGPWFGENAINARLTNLASSPQVVKINTRVTGPTRRAHFFEMAKLTLAAGESRPLPVRYVVQRGGRCAVEVTVQGIIGNEAPAALRTAPMSFELPPIGAELDGALSNIARAYRTYALLPADARPLDGASRLDMLLARWRYLDSQQQRKASQSPDVVMALVTRARTLADDAVALNAELRPAAP